MFMIQSLSWPTKCNLQIAMYVRNSRLNHQVSGLGWVELNIISIWMFHSSCPAASSILPNSHQPKQNLADLDQSQPNPGPRPDGSPCNFVLSIVDWIAVHSPRTKVIYRCPGGKCRGAELTERPSLTQLNNSTRVESF